MKKIVSLIGAGAMVVTFGLNCGLAQQKTTETLQQPAVSAPAEVEKGKIAATKPEIKVEKDANVKETLQKPVDKATVQKPSMDVKSDKMVAPAKPETAANPGKAVLEKPAVKSSGEKAAVEKPSVPSESKTAKAPADKSQTVKPEDKKIEPKTVEKTQ